MKAVVVHGPKDLRVDDVPEPVCGPDQVIVEVDYGGICGSDLHYWQDGAAGVFRLREPLILGHEVAGRIVEVGADVDGLRPGQPVSPHPATAAAGCPPELAGSIGYFGSAATSPHTQGAFVRYKAIPAYQVRLLPAGLPTRLAALTEPLAVGLHAISRAGDLAGRTVLVLGVGPIGSLLVAAAKAAGAAHVTAVDLQPFSLQMARRAGADATVDLAAGAEPPTGVDVVFEASGSPAAVGAGLAACRRGGVMVQVGNLAAGDIPVRLAGLVSREVDYRGTFRFGEEIVAAIAALAGGLRVGHLISHTFPVEEAAAAFATALDRTRSSKVMISFG